MRLVVDAPEAGSVDVAVHLRRRERAVSEQLLDRPQVGAALEEVRRECVAQPVRVGQEASERARVEPPAASRQEQRVVRAPRELGPRLAKIDRKSMSGLLAQRHY